jgi:hypothetical protein
LGVVEASLLLVGTPSVSYLLSYKKKILTQLQCNQTVPALLPKSFSKVPWMQRPMARASHLRLGSMPEDLAVVEAETLRLLLVGTPSVSHLLSYEKKRLKQVQFTTQSNNGTTYPSEKELQAGTGRFGLLDPAPHVRASEG